MNENNKLTMAMAAVFGLTAIVLGGGMLVVASLDARKPTFGEFVCYDDGRLVERHVGVSHASRWDNGLWMLRYVDQDKYFVKDVSYRQSRGETCQMEYSPR
jgi:hypothetical protein